MLSINMRIFKTAIMLVSLCIDVRSLPLTKEDGNSLEIPAKSTEDHYDQRQNGTENYRVHVDGVILVIAPVEALLLAGASGSDTVTLPIGTGGSSKPEIGVSEKPKPDVVDGGSATARPSVAPKSMHRIGQQLASIITPLLRRLHHE